MSKLQILILSTALVLVGCAPQRNNPVNAAYHDLTAHYNAYWLANEHIKEIEQTLFDKYSWNYNKILPIFVPFDSTDTASMSKLTEDCIRKASLAIQRHPESKWEYPGYILVGKARFYRLEFADAVEAYKYVNTKSKNKDDRHEALAHLLRAFTKNFEYQNALAVIDYLEKEELNTRNAQLFYMNQAHLYQELGDLNLMVQNLVKAEEIMISAKDKARIQFIIGQVYQKLGFDASAFYYYEKSLRNHPSYELSFYTKLNMAQVTELSEGKDIKTVRKYFKRLLTDRKNFEYNDKIYFEMGQFEEKQGNLEEAINHYKTSTRVSTQNARQKGLSYLSLGRIHYDSLREFEIAKNYYDSAVNTLPKDEDNYAEIKERKEILSEFVKHITTIRKNDSLLVLSEMPEDELIAYTESIIQADSTDAAEKKAAKEKLAKATQQRQNQSKVDESLINLDGGSGTWYFDNVSSVSSGLTNFERKWGKRELEDHWRRSNKIANIISEEENNSPTETGQQIAKETNTEESGESKSLEELLKGVPRTDEEKEKLRIEIKDALYNVGNIYSFRLLEKDNAIETFDNLLERFPASDYEPEVLYQLYLLQRESNPPKSEEAASRLANMYPESIYAKLITNPNFREETFAATIHLQETYKEAFDYYESKEYARSIAMLDSALAIYPDNEFSDNLVLLRTLNIGLLEGQHKYQLELDHFINAYPDSELIPYAKKLAASSQEYKLNLYSSSKALYKPSSNQPHYFLLVYPGSTENSEIATSLIKKYISENEEISKYGNILLSEKYSMVAVSNLKDKTHALEILQDFSQKMNPFEALKGQEHYLFVISEENFEQFYKTKDIENYRTFFDKNYL